MLRKIVSNSFAGLPRSCYGLRVSKAFGTYKTSTGLVGLAVDKNGRENLLNLSNDILLAVKKIPDNSGYRINVEKWYSFISKVTTATDDIRAIEAEIGLGQIEEVIEMAKDERELVDYYFENKGWERVADAEKNADSMLEEMADSIFFSDPSKSTVAATATPQK